MGVLNAHLYNVRAYNQHIQTESLPSLVVLSMLTPSKLGLFNVLPYNSVALNSGTPKGGVNGAVTMNVTLNKVIFVSNVSSSALGVFNTTLFNTRAFNAAATVDNSSGKATMTAMLSTVSSSIEAVVTGSVFVGGGGSTIVTSQIGGYNSAPYLGGPFNDANYVNGSLPSDQLVEFISGAILEFRIEGRGTIDPEPWLQAYNLNSIAYNQKSTLLTSNSKSVYLHTV